MNFEEIKNFKIESASLKEVRVFAREVFKKSSIFTNLTILKGKLVLISSKISYNKLKLIIKIFCLIILKNYDNSCKE